MSLCKHGHDVNIRGRNSSGNCRECVRLRVAAYRAEDVTLYNSTKRLKRKPKGKECQT